MGNFKPVFTYSIQTSKKQLVEKAFEQCYQRNKQYFDSFHDSVDVCFNETPLAMIKMVGNFTPEQNQSHQDKIRAFVDTIRTNTQLP
jgi:hypothetical protein